MNKLADYTKPPVKPLSTVPKKTVSDVIKPKGTIVSKASETKPTVTAKADIKV